jgi:exosortase H (IPTLxxWG-CTERM-specific)
VRGGSPPLPWGARPGPRFCFLFTLYTLLSFGVLYAAQALIVDPVNRHLARVSASVLELFGVGASAQGAMLTVTGFAVEIKNNCNAVYEIGLYAAAIWAYPASLTERLIGSLSGALVLYVVNLLRILTLFLVGLLRPEWFEVTHLYAWQVLFLVVVAACWFGWASRVRAVA